MASGAAADGLFGNVFGGTISTDDMGIQHRPYHRNCTCALHKSGENTSSYHHHHHHHGCPSKVSYPVRRSWSEGSLVAMMSSSQASPGSSPSSPAPPPPPPSSGAPRLPPHGHHR